MYEDLQAQLEDLKGEKASKENDELIAELKAQVADLKKSREELEDRIESEKRERTKRANDKDVPAARPTQSYARSDSSYRPAAQPTYSGGSNLPVGGTQGFISPTPGVVTSAAAAADFPLA